MGAQRPPIPALRPFVRCVWSASTAEEPGWEHVLPTGDMHIVFRLRGNAIRIGGATFGSAVVGGARSAYYVKVAEPASSVGVTLRPGAAASLLGAPAGALSEQHTALGDLWTPGGVARVLSRLEQARDPMAELETVMLERVRGATCHLHPAVATALLCPQESVEHMVARSGYSHRRFVSLFREAVGLPPKTWLRVQRFNSVLPSVTQGRLADVAAAAGYSDQSHMTREFLEMAGVTPSAYRAMHLPEPRHVLLPNAHS